MLTLKRFQHILRKFAAVGSKPTPESFPELEDCIVWLRFIIAIAYGTYLGSTPGALACILGLNVITFIPVLYCQMILLADMDEYKNLHFAGVLNALAMMILTWIFGFTRHFSADELKMASMVVMQQIVVNQDPDDGLQQQQLSSADSLSESSSIGTADVTQDTEF
ncbi:hypothetical protein MHU86_17359 [Fragilaria crotonensis]|nr:hypothetical protein MHU86_17359 [Fragilaria crotonensis]